MDARSILTVLSLAAALGACGGFDPGTPYRKGVRTDTEQTEPPDEEDAPDGEAGDAGDSGARAPDAGAEDARAGS